ncbi:MAG: hypothetical protein MOGMAGMI_02337 [Candidatus Omnitrophica bacterium]|nr:hypothetical protein [Candidatus Omnitrophota bacterium]
MRNKISVLILAALLMSGCASMNPFHSIQNPPAEPRKMAKWSQEETVEPVIVGEVAGKAVVANRVHRTYAAGNEETAPKRSIFSKLLALGWGWVILMVLGIFFPPIAAIMGVFNRTASIGVQKIVTGVQHGLDKFEDSKTYSGKEVKEMMLTKMSRVYDDKTKKLVRQVKSKGIPTDDVPTS